MAVGGWITYIIEQNMKEPTRLLLSNERVVTLVRNFCERDFDWMSWGMVDVSKQDRERKQNKKKKGEGKQRKGKKIKQKKKRKKKIETESIWSIVWSRSSWNTDILDLMHSVPPRTYLVPGFVIWNMFTDRQCRSDRIAQQKSCIIELD